MKAVLIRKNTFMFHTMEIGNQVDYIINNGMYIVKYGLLKSTNDEYYFSKSEFDNFFMSVEDYRNYKLNIVTSALSLGKRDRKKITAAAKMNDIKSILDIYRKNGI